VLTWFVKSWGTVGLMRKRIFFFCWVLLWPVCSFASTLKLVENETVYLIKEVSCSTLYPNPIITTKGLDFSEKVWFSVTYKKERNDYFEFVVHGFVDRQEGGRLWMNTQNASCSKEAQKIFFLLQKHLVGHPIRVQILSDTECVVDSKVFEDLEEANASGEGEEEGSSEYSLPTFARSQFYQHLTQHFLSLKGKELQQGSVIDCMRAGDLSVSVRESATILDDVGMYMITRTDPSAIEAIYRAEYRIKEAFFLFHGNLKGTIKWDATNLLRQFSHFESEVKTLVLGLPCSVTKSSSDLFPYFPGSK
jgi:hypothetical protein